MATTSKDSELTKNGVSFEEMLFNEDLVTTETDTLYKQYELYVNLMDKVYERRSNINTFYLSINSFLLTTLAAFLSQIATIGVNNSFWILVAACAGGLFCLTWRRTILVSRVLIGRKYKVIHLLEQKLPARLFDVEWEMLESKGKYVPFSDIEKFVPLVFIGAYGAIVVFSLIQLFQ